MKPLVLILLFLTCVSSHAIDDPAILAAGDWSEPTGVTVGTLRGRLLLCESPKDKDTAVYLELQECSDAWGGDIQVYCNMNPDATHLPKPGTQEKERFEKAAMTWEMRDGTGKLVPPTDEAFSGGMPGISWVIVQCDGSVRLRASVYANGKLKNGGLRIYLPFGIWDIPPDSTTDHYLSCTFTVEPPADHVAPPDSRLWKGTLKLPRVKIPARKS